MASTNNQNHNHKSNKKIDEAIQLLREAAIEKKNEIRTLFTGRIEDAKEFAQGTAEEQKIKVLKAAQKVDRKVKKNPWPAIGAAAFGALLTGLILGSKNKKKNE